MSQKSSTGTTKHLLTPPFDEADELEHALNSPTQTHLPGHPRVLLNNKTHFAKFLQREFRSEIMELMAPYLWIMSTQRSNNISPLHRQIVKQRQLIVSEDPKLHLVWLYDRIFLKPLPRYLLSYAFWTRYLLSSATSPLEESDRKAVLRCALGFLRSYFYLVQHESDFRLAQREDLGLIPKEVTWEQFCRFSASLKVLIDDADVAERYHYGEVRLTRLNLYVKLILWKPHYQRLYTQYAEYFARFFAPLLFIFGFVSVVLSGMQVVMSVEQFDLGTWDSFRAASRWFPVVIMVLLCVVLLSLGIILIYKIAAEWKHALSDRYRLKWKKVKNRQPTNP